MSAAVAAILEGMPEPRDLRMHEHDGRCVITAGTVVLFDYAAGDVVMRNMALAVLRQLGFGGRAVAAALGLSEAYVATLHSAARRDGSAALAMQDRRGTPGKVTAAQWEQAERGIGQPRPGFGATREGNKGKALEVLTTHLLPGYLRKNGFPVSGNAVVKEDFDLFTERTGQPWFVVTTILEDPLYLQEPFVTSTNFKKQPDAAGWNPRPCSAR